MVCFTKAGKTTACGGALGLGSPGGHCHRCTRLPADLPGRWPPDGLLLVPLPAVAAGLTPSNGPCTLDLGPAHGGLSPPCPVPVCPHLEGGILPSALKSSPPACECPAPRVPWSMSSLSGVPIRPPPQGLPPSLTPSLPAPRGSRFAPIGIHCIDSCPSPLEPQPHPFLPPPPPFPHHPTALY